MKALVYTAPDELQYRSEADPEPRDGDLLVQIEAVGICGSDMHAYHGHDDRRVAPLILGHEAMGWVLSAGPRQGERVVLNPLITCGECPACQSGRSNLCEQRELIGMRRPGAFAERIAMPQRNLIALPEHMDPAHAALTEPAATALHAIQLGDRVLQCAHEDTRALVIGGGSVGLLSALYLRKRGIREITLAETNPLRRRSAQARCALHTLDPRSSPPRGPFDLVIDAVGSTKTRALASAVVAAGGVLVHIGLQDARGGLDVRRMTLAEITFIGSYTYSPEDLRAAADALHAGDLGDLSWIEERPLCDGAAAFSDLAAGQTGAAKIVLRLNQTQPIAS